MKRISENFRLVFINLRKIRTLTRLYSSQQAAFAQKYGKSFQRSENRKFDGLSELAKSESKKVEYLSDHVVKKDSYTEHPKTAERSEDEIEKFKQSHGIEVKGTNIPKPILNFDELCLPESCMRILLKENYSEPSPIQSYGFPVALSGRDLIGVSQTGSGKTLAYMLPAILHATNQQHLGGYQPQVLVLGPTRELIQQIYQVSQKYIGACGLSGACAFGGASRMVQLQKIENANIVVGTPGRLLDFLSGNEMNLAHCSCVVLDEADRMLDMGFEPQIRGIIDRISEDRQTMMWSATWPPEIRDLAEEFLRDYVHITIGSGELRANPNIQQNIHVIQQHEKDDVIIALLDEVMKRKSKVLMFAQTKQKVDYLANYLRRYRCLRIHGDVSQYGRDQVIKRFRSEKSCVLVATDVAARGLDITDIDVVVNYDFPLNIEDYIHRIGRTARGTSCGVAHSFFTPENSGLVRELITLLKMSNQTINPELYKLQPVASPKRSYRYPPFRSDRNNTYNYRNNMYKQYRY